MGLYAKLNRCSPVFSPENKATNLSPFELCRTAVSSPESRWTTGRRRRQQKERVIRTVRPWEKFGKWVMMMIRTKKGGSKMNLWRLVKWGWGSRRNCWSVFWRGGGSQEWRRRNRFMKRRRILGLGPNKLP